MDIIKSGTDNQFVTRNFFSSLLIIMVFNAYCASLSGQEKVVPYLPKPWVAKIWVSQPPAKCPFTPSFELTAIAFTRKYISYTDADTWYPSWASDGKFISRKI